MKENKPEIKPEPQMVEIVMDLAPSAGGAIVHCGVTYVDRGKYTVPQGTANDLLEIQNRGWAHESSLKENENRARRQNRTMLSGRA